MDARDVVSKAKLIERVFKPLLDIREVAEAAVGIEQNIRELEERREKLQQTCVGLEDKIAHLAAELFDRRKAADAELTKVTTEARAAADQTYGVAGALLVETKARADEFLTKANADVEDRQRQAQSLDAIITTKRAELARLETLAAELRKKLATV